MQRVGAHVSTAGGLRNAIVNAQKIGANCLQIFSSAPQQWQGSSRTPEEKAAFKKSVMDVDISPIFVHGTYLMNFASDNQEILTKSISCLTGDLRFVHDIGATGVIFHFGSHTDGWVGKRESLIKIFRKILEDTPEDTQIIIENAAGSGTKIGTKLTELALIRDDLNSPRISFCLDSAHAFAGGYDLRTSENVVTYVKEVDKVLGWDLVAAIHLNDSKVEFGKNADRHENIGEGYIGKVGLKSFVTQLMNMNKPFILEVPGFAGTGPDAENIKRVKEFIS